MAEAAAFDLVCTRLEEQTSLDRLATRGTVRLALKQAGLEARSITPDQMAVVLAKVLPGELETRGIENASALCGALVEEVHRVAGSDGPETPDAVFQRLGGS